MRGPGIFSFVVVTSLLTSCAPSLYFPERVVTSCFKDKNQAFLNVSWKLQANSSDTTNRTGSPFSFAASMGYSFSKHFGLYAGYHNLNNRAVAEVSHQKYWGIGNKSITGGIFNGNRFEGGLIYFTPVRKYFLFECAAGYSFGTINRISDVSPDRNLSTDYYSIFVQPNYGAKIDWFTFSGGVKLAYHRYYNFNALPLVKAEFYSDAKPLTQIPYWFFGPFVNFEGGFRFVKLNAQAGLPVSFRSSEQDPMVAGFPLYLSVGASFRLEQNVFGDIKKIFKKNR